MAPPTEGALAPDLGFRRGEPLREIPALRKAAREKSWKDEVRDRVKSRRETRGVGQQELPIFRDESGAPGEPAEPSFHDEPVNPFDAAPPPAPAPVFVPPPQRHARASAPALRIDDDALDLPLREPEPAFAPPPPASASPARSPHGGMDLGEPVAREDVDEQWSLGMADDRDRPEPTPVERPATVAERGAAAALDAVLLLGLWAVVVYFAGRAAHVPTLGLVTRASAPWLGGFLVFLALTYASYFTGTTGQTIGKIAAGLRVVDIAGRPPGYARAFARSVLAGVGTLAGLGGLVPMFVDPARRALHDRLLGTRVIKN